jgi:hypothetical protein
MTTLQTMLIEDTPNLLVEEHTFAIRFVPPLELTIGYHRRAAHAVRLVRSALAKVPNCKIEVINNTLTAKTADINKSDLLDGIDLAQQRLEQFGAQKITAKAVESIFRITAVERQCWTKDGRLPNSGTEFFQRGSSKIKISTYSREMVLTLYQNLD